jgi:CRISPR-associated protein Csb1
MSTMTYDELRDAVGGSAVGLRARIPLEPLGGPGDKVAPPTYKDVDGRETVYAEERRRIEGESVDAVVLDSVASQANRFELALLDAYRRRELSVPMVSVDFRGTGLVGLDRLSHLEVSHRIFDAALRDSLYDGFIFRLSEAGRRITEATPRNAAAVFHYSPTTLLFGGWDSTGPRGGLGSKYERAITSEVVALGVQTGVRTASRIDPLGIEKDAGWLYKAAGQSTDEPAWTLDEGGAARDSKGQAVKYARSDTKKESGRPSQANLGNVLPSIDPRAGGITADHISATVVLSFPALRKLRFPADVAGEPIPDEGRRAGEQAAWTALASLGIAAALLAVEDGFDLRSRCVLRPLAPLHFELLVRDGSDPKSIEVDRAAALDLLATSRRAAADAGLPWLEDELLLTPSDRLVDLIRRSQQLSRAGEADS